jgi:hypothetical protein
MRPADLPPVVIATNISQEQVLLRNLINIMPGVKAPITFGVYSDPQKMVVWHGLVVMRKSKMLKIEVEDHAGEHPEHRAARQVALDGLLDGKEPVVHLGGEHDDTWDREVAGSVTVDTAPVVTPPSDPDVAAPQSPNASTLQDPDVNPLVKPTQMPPPAVTLPPAPLVEETAPPAPPAPETDEVPPPPAADPFAAL